MLFYIKEKNFVFVKGGEEVYENILFELVINFLLYFVRIVKIFIFDFFEEILFYNMFFFLVCMILCIIYLIYLLFFLLFDWEEGVFFIFIE